jgi:hypothetical protein
VFAKLLELQYTTITAELFIYWYPLMTKLQNHPSKDSLITSLKNNCDIWTVNYHNFLKPNAPQGTHIE